MIAARLIGDEALAARLATLPAEAQASLGRALLRLVQQRNVGLGRRPQPRAGSGRPGNRLLRRSARAMVLPQRRGPRVARTMGHPAQPERSFLRAALAEASRR